MQVNATSYDHDQIVQFAEAAECDSVILQRRYPPDSEPPLKHHKVEYLQDMSKTGWLSTGRRPCARLCSATDAQSSGPRHTDCRASNILPVEQRLLNGVSQ